MKFQIKRSEWRRGQGSFGSCLLSRHGEGKCCVGFFCLAAGLTEDQIRAKCYIGTSEASSVRPSEFPDPELAKPWIGTMRYGKSKASEPIYIVNDDPHIPDDMREGRLKQLFAELGHEVEFVE